MTETTPIWLALRSSGNPPTPCAGRLTLKRIEALTDDPRPVGSEKLSGQERFRVRQGVYRIIYEIRDEELVIIVVKTGHRRDVYRDS